eukprot:1159139-Pelagomonas_calceolata.AAC.1
MRLSSTPKYFTPFMPEIPPKQIGHSPFLMLCHFFMLQQQVREAHWKLKFSLLSLPSHSQSQQNVWEAL